MTAVVYFGNHLPPEQFNNDIVRGAVLSRGLRRVEQRVGVVKIVDYLSNACAVTINADAATIERIRAQLAPLGIEVSVVESKDKPAFKGA